jgi:manganese transport protein
MTKFRMFLGFLGPAFIISVAYIDPGNFATNICGGSKFGYALLWVILCSNIIAIFMQSLSAKLGIATGENLPQVCADIFPKSVNWVLWSIAEIAAIATSLAEFLGGTLGLILLFKIPIIDAGLITAALTLGIIYLQKYGQRALEAVIGAFVGIICIAYGIELFLAEPDWVQAGIHTIIPSLRGSEALVIAAGMLGATVMPHVIYLHSQLVQHRNHELTLKEKRKHLKMEKLDILIAMNIAFFINAAMVVVSAAVFYKQGMSVKTIEEAHRSLAPLIGEFSSAAFGIALLASGLSSAAVGTMAGTTIMQGFIRMKIPEYATRVITMAPGLLIIILGINAMTALVFSQVILSFALPVAIIPLLLITSRKRLMGSMVNRPLTNLVGWIMCTAIIMLNALLIIQALTG